MSQDTNRNSTIEYGTFQNSTVIQRDSDSPSQAMKNTAEANRINEETRQSRILFDQPIRMSKTQFYLYVGGSVFVGIIIGFGFSVFIKQS